VKFLVDNQLPPALARFISQDLGTKAHHVIDFGLRDAHDIQIWRYASSSELILISKDEEFIDLWVKEPVTKLLWVRLGNCRRVYLLDVFRQLWPRACPQLSQMVAAAR
jgi:predicted nuclease of predicted toxin-antitoxin system